MGQYHYVVNLDRKEFLHPHRFGDGLKLLEFGSSGDGTMNGLAILLATSNGRGGGDLSTTHYVPNPDPSKAGKMEADSKRAALIDEYVIGRWAGDRIAIVGDYHEPGDIPGFTDKLVAETGRYSGPDKTTGEDTYNDPVVGDVPWNQTLKGSKNQPVLDLGWTDISDVVIEAMCLDEYLKKSIDESAARYGGQKKPVSHLDDNGMIIRLVQNIEGGD